VLGLQKIRSDVELRATDDRICLSCFQKNEEELAAQRRHVAAKDGTPKIASHSGQAGAMVCSAGPEARRDYVAARVSPSTERHANGRPLRTPVSAASTSMASDRLDELNEYRQKIEELKCQVCVLTETLAKQSVAISTLTSRLNHMLSFLSIPGNDGSEQSATESTSENHLDIAANQSTESAESRSAARKKFCGRHPPVRLYNAIQQ
jgi:hypothetical protein